MTEIKVQIGRSGVGELRLPMMVLQTCIASRRSTRQVSIFLKSSSAYAAKELVDPDGTPSNDKNDGLRLQLRDFAALKELKTEPNSLLEPVFITYKHLSDLCLRVRRQSKEIREKQREMPESEPGMRTHEREVTPAE